MRKLVYILLFCATNIIAQEKMELPWTNIKGTVLHAQTGDTLEMMRIKLFVNDTLRGFGQSDFDAYFQLTSHRVLTDMDVVDLQFFYPHGFMEEVRLTYPKFENLLISVSPDLNISSKEIHNFGGKFLIQIPNYLDCQPSPPIDPFEVK